MLLCQFLEADLLLDVVAASAVSARTWSIGRHDAMHLDAVLKHDLWLGRVALQDEASCRVIVAIRGYLWNDSREVRLVSQTPVSAFWALTIHSTAFLVTAQVALARANAAKKQEYDQEKDD